jgi:hypothetical protein
MTHRDPLSITSNSIMTVADSFLRKVARHVSGMSRRQADRVGTSTGKHRVNNVERRRQSTITPTFENTLIKIATNE